MFALASTLALGVGTDATPTAPTDAPAVDAPAISKAEFPAGTIGQNSIVVGSVSTITAATITINHFISAGGVPAYPTDYPPPIVDDWR